MGEGIIQTRKGNLPCYVGNTPGQKGVRFMINKKWKEKLEIFNKGISGRVAMAKFKLGNGRAINIIQVYAPTAMAEDEECEKIFPETLYFPKSLASKPIRLKISGVLFS